MGVVDSQETLTSFASAVAGSRVPLLMSAGVFAGPPAVVEDELLASPSVSLLSGAISSGAGTSMSRRPLLARASETTRRR